MRVKEKSFSLIEFLVAVAIISTLSMGTAMADEDGKPNIVFILADDQDFQSLEGKGVSHCILTYWGCGENMHV